MAHRDHPQVELHSGDTVVFSATPIPGNERAVNETIDRLYHIGCDVITTKDAPIHASGHGYQEEIKLMLNLTKPRYVMPFHGDHKRIHLHGQLAEAVGVAPENIFKGENGLPLELDAKGARWGKKVQSGMIFVDGVDIGDVTDVALRDRRMLSADGIFVVVATISEQDGSSVAEPEVIFRGVPVRRRRRQAARPAARLRRELARARRQGRDPRDRPAPGDPARRPRRVRLRQDQAPADGAAGRRRGLARGRRDVRLPLIGEAQQHPAVDRVGAAGRGRAADLRVAEVDVPVARAARGRRRAA